MGLKKEGLSNPEQWERAISLTAGAGERIKAAMTTALFQEAHRLRAIMVAQFDNGVAADGTAWKPLSPLALAVRRFTGFAGTKILVRSTTLRNNISVIPVADGFFIGITRNARRGDGKDPVNVAKVQEEGASFTMTMTAKQRAFLFAAIAKAGLGRTSSGKGRGGGPWTVTITIPARPFIAPVFNSIDQSAFESRIRDRMAKLLGGDFG